MYGIFLKGIRVYSICRMNGIRIGGLLIPATFHTREAALGYIQRSLSNQDEDLIQNHDLTVKPL